MMAILLLILGIGSWIGAFFIFVASIIFASYGRYKAGTQLLFLSMACSALSIACAKLLDYWWTV